MPRGGRGVKDAIEREEEEKEEEEQIRQKVAGKKGAENFIIFSEGNLNFHAEKSHKITQTQIIAAP